MQQNVIFFILNIIGLGLILKWISYQLRAFFTFKDKKKFFTFKRFKFVGIILILVTIPILLVNKTELESLYHVPKDQIDKNLILYAAIISFLISAVWLKYILKLDIYDKEKKQHILLIIVLSVISTLFADFWYNSFHSIGIVDAKAPIQSFLYSVFGIGLIEETIKFIPLLIILKFTKAIDEPYDYILYASTSALSFAFVENIMYLHNHGLEIINARALYATVAHMTFSSTIAYGLYLNKFKAGKYSKILVFLFFYILAITAHGFYDFWIMNEVVSDYNGITTLFFLATIHIWFLMKNNTINNSNYYSKDLILNNDQLKVYLMISLLSIFMFGYLYVAFVWDAEEANHFFLNSVFAYGYILFYLIATLSNYNIIEGFMRPIRVRLGILFFKNR